MSVIGMLYRLYQEEIIQNVVVAEIAVKGATVVSSLIKEIQTYRTTTTTSRTSASSCPTATATTLVSKSSCCDFLEQLRLTDRTYSRDVELKIAKQNRRKRDWAQELCAMV